ncbi:ornithine aminomutase subunit alpha [Paratissierella segnis]|jgi:D-ornithine 4,5-aminomutase subunit alpha|uniref:Ornithine aminomutase subunit alpha n=1 Tax=Paratissierella segnis TaxID=2763679 RepID=A0A926EVI7_9FIRM|nr:ornithine aminomutase subunit alpha [Paratissierella segnis]MBC8587005.1 ornithine aminomutase subunit alpha [Paratissierella segnis]
MSREDDFDIRRQHLKNLSEEELESRFWELAGKIVDPIIELAEKHTTPSIERSVLLRMGFSSPESTAIVENAIDRGLIGKGAGHIVYKLAKAKNIDYRDAGLSLVDGDSWDEVVSLFKGGAN